MTQEPSSTSDIRRLSQLSKQNFEDLTDKLQESQSCLNEMAEILDLLCKSVVIAEQVDSRFRCKILQDLEDFKTDLEKIQGDNQKTLELISKLAQDTLASQKYLRRICCEDENGKPLTGFSWMGYHLTKGSQSALAGIIVAILYYFLRYGLPKIMHW